MANQMIALQARGPQLPDVGAINARYANIMANMATAREKQDAAQRAAEFRTRAESGVDVLTPEGFNQLSGLDPEGAAALRKSALEKQKADAEFTLGYLGTVNEELQRANTPEQALAIGQSLKKVYPMFADNIDQTLAKMPTDSSQFPSFRQQLNLSALKASERIEYEIEKLKSKEIIGEGGQVGVLTTGGLGAPTIRIPKTYEPGAAQGGTVEMGEQATVEPGVGGIDENAPVSAEDAEAFIASFPKAAQPAIRQRIMEGALGNIPMGSPVAPQGLVAGERGGMGGPLEGYVESATPFRARVPAPPQGPQPRETAAEAADKRKAVLAVEREFELNKPPAKPTPLTEAQRLERRDKLAGDSKKAQALLDKTYGEAGIVETVNAVRNLSRDQKEAITGYSAYAPSVFKSSKDADTAVQNLKDTVTELGKEAAAASGAIGAMAVQEWKIVAGMIANLDLEGMSAEGLDAQLNRIEAKAKNAARLTQEAFAAQYNPDLKTMPEFRLKMPAGAGRAAPKPGSQYPVMTPEQVRKAPKGTKYRTTDGRIGEKP